MSSLIPKDPLLSGTKLLLRIVLVFVVVALAALVLAVPGLFVFRGQVLAEIAKSRPGVDLAGILPQIAALLAITAGFLALALAFLRHLLAILATVETGDPFTAANADRLAAMGWIALAGQLIGLLVGWAAMTLARRIPDVQGDLTITLNGVLLVLVLFILARVFRLGARMRADLEGTV